MKLEIINFIFFYNVWGTNTLELWLKENPESLKNKADINWVKAKLKKRSKVVIILTTVLCCELCWGILL